MVKFKLAADVVPALLTLAAVPAAPVMVEPTATVAAAPAAPCGPVLPAGPGGPVAPGGPADPVAPPGMVKFKMAADVVPELLTLGCVPAAPVAVLPTVTVAAEPAGPVTTIFNVGSWLVVVLSLLSNVIEVE